MITEKKIFGTTKMNWNSITTEEQIDSLVKESENTPVLIFKHSTRCSISSMVKDRVERSWIFDGKVKPYYLDLITYRNISNLIAEKFNVEHQSPQAILLKNGQVQYDASHMAISLDQAVNILEK